MLWRMERYFFDFSECGRLFADEEGVELADLGAARDRAIQAARDVMCGEIRDGRLCLSCCINVHDAEGRLLLVVPFRDAITVTGLGGTECGTEPD